MVQGCPQGIDIRPLVGLGEAVLFRRGKASGSQKGCVLLQMLLWHAGGIKVNETDMAVLCEKDIGRLDIAVYDALSVKKFQDGT